MSITKRTKSEIRKEYLKKRLMLNEHEVKELSAKVYDAFFKNISLQKKAVVAAYYPVRGELDVLPIIKKLLKKGHVCAMPHVAGDMQPLVFKVWDEETEMKSGLFNIPEPNTDATVVPDVVLVPMLAFNNKNYRIGYGSGLYDRTIAHIKKSRDVLTIGLAYEQQLCGDFDTDKTDIALDMIVTDKNIYTGKG